MYPAGDGTTFTCHQLQLKRPVSGPSFAAYFAILCTVLYVVLLRDPSGVTVGFLKAIGLPPILPLGSDFPHALALLCLITVPLQNRALFPQPATARQISETLVRWIPGFRAVLVPSEIGATGSTRPPGVLHVDTFGYERLPEDDRGGASPAPVAGNIAGNSVKFSSFAAASGLGRRDNVSVDGDKEA